MTELLTELPDGGTRAEIRILKPSAEEREAFAQIAPIVEPLYQRSIANLVEVLATEVAARSREQIAEPELPSSGGRYATAPVGPPKTASDAVDSDGVRSSSG
jgi:hypothetical protein